MLFAFPFCFTAEVGSARSRTLSVDGKLMQKKKKRKCPLLASFRSCGKIKPHNKNRQTTGVRWKWMSIFRSSSHTPNRSFFFPRSGVYRGLPRTTDSWCIGRSSHILTWRLVDVKEIKYMTTRRCCPGPPPLDTPLVMEDGRCRWASPYMNKLW